MRSAIPRIVGGASALHPSRLSRPLKQAPQPVAELHAQGDQGGVPLVGLAFVAGDHRIHTQHPADERALRVAKTFNAAGLSRERPVCLSVDRGELGELIMVRHPGAFAPGCRHWFAPSHLRRFGSASALQRKAMGSLAASTSLGATLSSSRFGSGLSTSFPSL